MNEQELRETICCLGKELYDKGLVSGTGGNLSVRIGDQMICSPTGVSLGSLDPNTLACVRLTGEHVSGARPTKEVPMHLAVYAADTSADAVVHTHSPFAVAYSCTGQVDGLIPIYTQGMLRKVGQVKLLPFRPSGSQALGELIREEIPNFQALLLENHGVLVTGKTLEQAVMRAGEIEDNLRIFFISGGKARTVPVEMVAKTKETYGG